jgi:sugar phosphate isomerase/epimerase
MRLSCCAYSYRQALQAGELSLPGFLELAAELGFDGVELTAYYFPTTERTFLNDMKRQAHWLGLSISGTAVGSDFAQPDEDLRREHVTMTRKWVQRSVLLGAPTLRVFAGGVREGQEESEAFDGVVRCLRQCAEFGWDRGVTMALENHGGLTGTAEGVLKILEAVDHPGLGVNLDFGNFSGDIYSQFAALAPYAVASHAKPNSNGYAPGERVAVDYREVRRILRDSGYRGFLAMEYEEAEPAVLAVPAFLKDLRSVFG